MNIGTIVVLALLAVAVGFAVRHLWKSRGGCAGCSGCGGGDGCRCSGSSSEKPRVK